MIISMIIIITISMKHEITSCYVMSRHLFMLRLIGPAGCSHYSCNHKLFSDSSHVQQVLAQAYVFSSPEDCVFSQTPVCPLGTVPCLPVPSLVHPRCSMYTYLSLSIYIYIYTHIITNIK